ncbi:hypothetical protein [Agrococcus sp. Marseille-P2731]|uniref:hypothetical protein n=1 Tax=Agrococcus sp. Marseille-P2731 TaxID=1841862 RepID=UPI00093048DD|nr:hypothetical protein [Agrococcus sp. Marseille-P2731]
MRRARGLAALLLLPLALGGCTTFSSSLETAPPAASDHGADHGPHPDGPHLLAEGRAFDPARDDVDPETDCDGRGGRETLTTFDRSAWPGLDVTAGDARLTCGNASGAGWRHIADGHTDDFGELADLVDADWEDVAWFAIDRALEQPTRVEEYRDDIVNYDVLVEYVDGGAVERSWMVTVGVGLGSGQIITSFPDEQH